MATFITQKYGPLALLGCLRLNDEYAAWFVPPVVDLFAEPFLFVLAPTRRQIVLRHDNHQDTGGFDLGPQFGGEMGGRIDILVGPNVQILEFGLERGDFGVELFDQGLGPALEWRISFFERVAVRIGDEDVIIEVRREI